MEGICLIIKLCTIACSQSRWMPVGISTKRTMVLLPVFCKMQSPKEYIYAMKMRTHMDHTAALPGCSGIRK